MFSVTDLTITLSAIAREGDPEEPFTVEASVKNRSSQPITVLVWNSPLDPKANRLGIFRAFETETGVEVPSHVLKINRVPPSEKDYVEIEAGGEVKVEHKLMWFPKNTGKQHRIVAEGEWMGIWRARKSIVVEQTEGERAEDAMRGQFSSSDLFVMN